MKRKLLIAALLSTAGLQAADTGSGVKSLAQKFGGGAKATPQTDNSSMISPKAITPLSAEEIHKLKGYVRTPGHVKLMLADGSQFAKPEMRAEADRVVAKLAGLLNESTTLFLQQQNEHAEKFSQELNFLLRKFATVMNVINREHESKDNTFGYDGQERRRVYAELAILRGQLDQGLYYNIKRFYEIDSKLAAGANLLNPGKKYSGKIQPNKALYANSAISRIAGERRAAKAQVAAAAAQASAAQAAAAQEASAAAATAQAATTTETTTTDSEQ